MILKDARNPRGKDMGKMKPYVTHRRTSADTTQLPNQVDRCPLCNNPTGGHKACIPTMGKHSWKAQNKQDKRRFTINP